MGIAIVACFKTKEEAQAYLAGVESVYTYTGRVFNPDDWFIFFEPDHDEMYPWTVNMD